MITRYLDFIQEDISTKKTYTESDPEYWGITDYKWVNGRLDVYEDIEMNLGRLPGLSKIPIPFGTVHGHFNCMNNNLTTLENCPIEITKWFNCRLNPLENFDHCPKKIGGYMECHQTGLYSITDYPLSIIGSIKNNVRCFFDVCNVVSANKGSFLPLLDDKIAFHRQVMRLAPELIPEYLGTDIPVPSNKTII